MKLKNIKWWILLIISFMVGLFWNKELNVFIFNNVDGKFDYQIMWTAIGAIITAIISFVSVWQTKRATYIAEISLKNEVIRNSCVIDFDDSNEPCVSIKNYCDNQEKGLYIIFKNYGNIDIENYEAAVLLWDASSTQPKLLSENPRAINGAFLRSGGTNSLTVDLPSVHSNMLQMKIQFKFITVGGITKDESITTQFIICEENHIDMREKFIIFSQEGKG